MGRAALIADPVAQARTALFFQKQRLDMGIALDVEIGAPPRGIDITTGCAHAPAIVDGGLSSANAFLVGAVVVGIALETDFFGRGKPGVVKRASVVGFGQPQRTVSAP